MLENEQILVRLESTFGNSVLVEMLKWQRNHSAYVSEEVPFSDGNVSLIIFYLVIHLPILLSKYVVMFVNFKI